MVLFSIIIALYNKEKYIKNTIESVLNQNFNNFEIIIINDGSTDNSLAIIDLINDDRIKIYHQKNQGAAAARNYGMEKANGKYICFLDADDEWMPNHLQSFYDAIQKFPDFGMVCNRYITKTSEKKFVKNIFLDISDDYEGYVKDFFKSSLINRIALTSTVCINKDILKNLTGFNTKFTNGEDTDFWIRIALDYNVVITKNTTLIYNQISENKSLSKLNINKKKLSDFKHFEKFEAENTSLKKFIDAHRLYYAIQYHLVGEKQKSLLYLKKIDKNNLTIKSKIILKLPFSIVKQLFTIKKSLNNLGLRINLYQ